ncbi:MAG: radical SAM protein [Desulfovibrio sp.]|nr:MAG: radical SAM protein [Desulfovibrio sp.]
MPRNTEHKPSHPCFGAGAHTLVGRAHLPVASRDYARMRFTGPAPAREALSPQAAFAWLKDQLNGNTPISVVGVTGPGDPMADPEATFTTLGLVRQAYPDITLCLTTLGMGLAAHAERLAELGVDHATLLMDSMDPAIVEQLFAWIRPAKHTLPLPEAAQLLVKDQAEAITALSEAGVTVKVNTTVYPGINTEHIEGLAKRVADLGATVMRLSPCSGSVETSGELDCPSAPCPPDPALMAELRELASKHIELMPEREGCGQDLVGFDVLEPLSTAIGAGGAPKATAERPFVAICSSSGLEVDQHLGHARQFMIYGPVDGLVVLRETRPAPEPGGGAARWEAMAEVLKDCFAVVAAAAGDTPRAILAELGLPVLITEADVDPAVDALYGGGKKCGNKRST